MSKSPISPELVAAIRARLQRDGEPLELALFETGISTALRAGDLLALTVADVLDATGAVRSTFTVTMGKTRRPVAVRLSARAQAAVRGHIEASGLSGAARLFPLSLATYARRVKSWLDKAGERDVSNYSTHSIRKTQVAHVYAKTKDLAACQTLLGHASLAHTGAYLGVGSTQAHALAAQYEV